MRYSGIGGQAVIEGVMMKNRDKCAVAVRKPDGDIQVKKIKCNDIREKSRIACIPFVRGIVSFVRNLLLGLNTLNYSALFLEEEESREEKEGTGNGLLMSLVTVVAVIFAIGVFILAPFFVTEALRRTIRSAQIRGLIEGVIRVILFLLYIRLLALSGDIRRIFMYHGAEHKTLQCLEKNLELTVLNVRKQSMRHRRCGTGFFLVVMLLSILLFMFIVAKNIWLRMFLRVLLIPVIAGLTYECIRFAGRHDGVAAKVLGAPVLWVQKLTTIEPDESMIEVAIAAVDAVFDWNSFQKEDEKPTESNNHKKKSAEPKESGKEKKSVKPPESGKQKKDGNAVKSGKPKKKSAEPAKSNKHKKKSVQLTEKPVEEDGIEIVSLDSGAGEEEDEILNALDRYFEAPKSDDSDENSK